MKKFFITLLLTFGFIGVLQANDAWYYSLESGQIVPADNTKTNVQMHDEVIELTLNSDCYEVTVHFNFYNEGETENLSVGFPFFESGRGQGKIWDFKCWTNGVETDYTDMPIEKNWQTEIDEYTPLENAYVRQITFPAHSFTSTAITYKCSYGRTWDYNRTASYLYGTGSSWKGSIGQMTVRITNNIKTLCIRSYGFPAQSGESGAEFYRVNGNTWEVVLHDVTPKSYTECIGITVGDILHDDGIRYQPREHFFCYYTKLTKRDIFWYTKAQLRILRNGIYAYNGYKFKSQDLIEYYNNSNNSYFKPDPNFSESQLTENERYNINLIFAEEQKL